MLISRTPLVSRTRVFGKEEVIASGPIIRNCTTYGVRVLHTTVQ